MSIIISAFGTFASIVSLALIPNIPYLIRIVLIILGAFCLVFSIVKARKETQINQRICTNEEEINNAMLEIIKSPGKIMIMSRDLSWVNGNKNVKEAIIKKKESIIIYAQKPKSHIEELEKAGVKVKYYGSGFEPLTRFTIIGYNRQSPQVAVSIPGQHSIKKKKKNKTRHIIYETSVTGPFQDKSITSLALDLQRLCELHCEGNNVQGNNSENS